MQKSLKKYWSTVFLILIVWTLVSSSISTVALTGNNSIIVFAKKHGSSSSGGGGGSSSKDKGSSKGSGSDNGASGSGDNGGGGSGSSDNSGASTPGGSDNSNGGSDTSNTPTTQAPPTQQTCADGSTPDSNGNCPTSADNSGGTTTPPPAATQQTTCPDGSAPDVTGNCPTSATTEQNAAPKTLTPQQTCPPLPIDANGKCPGIDARGGGLGLPPPPPKPIPEGIGIKCEQNMHGDASGKCVSDTTPSTQPGNTVIDVGQPLPSGACDKGTKVGDRCVIGAMDIAGVQTSGTCSAGTKIGDRCMIIPEPIIPIPKVLGKCPVGYERLGEAACKYVINTQAITPTTQTSTTGAGGTTSAPAGGTTTTTTPTVQDGHILIMPNADGTCPTGSHKFGAVCDKDPVTPSVSSGGDTNGGGSTGTTTNTGGTSTGTTPMKTGSTTITELPTAQGHLDPGSGVVTCESGSHKVVSISQKGISHCVVDNVECPSGTVQDGALCISQRSPSTQPSYTVIDVDVPQPGGGCYRGTQIGDRCVIGAMDIAGVQTSGTCSAGTKIGDRCMIIPDQIIAMPKTLGKCPAGYHVVTPGLSCAFDLNIQASTPATTQTGGSTGTTTTTTTPATTQTGNAGGTTGTTTNTGNPTKTPGTTQTGGSTGTTTTTTTPATTQTGNAGAGGTTTNTGGTTTTTTTTPKTGTTGVGGATTTTGNPTTPATTTTTKLPSTSTTTTTSPTSNVINRAGSSSVGVGGGGSTTATAIPAQGVNNFLTYVNALNKITIRYPSTWTKTEFTGNPSIPVLFNAPTIVTTTPNPGAAKTGFVINITPSAANLDSYTQQQINGLTHSKAVKYTITDSNAKVLTPPTGITAFREISYDGMKNIIINNNNNTPTQVPLKGAALFFVDGGTGYSLLYLAKQTEYAQNLPMIQQMVNSFQIGSGGGAGAGSGSGGQSGATSSPS